MLTNLIKKMLEEVGFKSSFGHTLLPRHDNKFPQVKLIVHSSQHCNDSLSASLFSFLFYYNFFFSFDEFEYFITTNTLLGFELK